MIKIIKNNIEPQLLTDFKKNCFEQDTEQYRNCTYPNLPIAKLKAILLKEQFNLCAYCNKVIEANTSSIEHWYPQNACKLLNSYKTPDGKDIDYYNLIVVCLGNNENPHFHHCDKERAKFDKYSQMLTVKPHDDKYEFENVFYYEGGKLLSKAGDENIQNDINKKLNLNHQTLINLRNKTFDEFIKHVPLNKEKKKLELKTQLQKYSTPNREGSLRKYCTVITHYIYRYFQNEKSR